MTARGSSIYAPFLVWPKADKGASSCFVCAALGLCCVWGVMCGAAVFGVVVCGAVVCGSVVSWDLGQNVL